MADFLCHTASLHLREWSDVTRERFAAFVGEQRLDSYEYSRRMASDELLDTFLDRDRTPGA